MTIKIAIGKLALMDDLATIENTLLRQGILILPIQTAHLQRLLIITVILLTGSSLPRRLPKK